jgi:hypothetical protein
MKPLTGSIPARFGSLIRMPILFYESLCVKTKILSEM